MIIAPGPAQTLEQRLEALDQANRVRSARALLKRRLKTDPTDAELVIRDPRIDYRTMLLRDLLLALPGLGEMRVDRFMVAARISPRKTLQGLSDRQRDEALQYVRAYAAHRRMEAA